MREQLFSFAVDEIFLMPVIPAMASSTLMQTPSSTSSGLAPFQATVTLTISREKEGMISLLI